MWDQWTVTSNRKCPHAADLCAKIAMRVSRVQQIAGKKFYLTVALKSLFFVELYNKMRIFDSLR